jgi:hypothetical protein
LETLAGLARGRLLQGEATQALADLDEVLAHVAAGGDFEGTEEPLWIYLICHDVLQANGDPRAEPMLQEAYRRLMKQAARFDDDAGRRMFLANIPHHREIVKAVTGAYPAAAPSPAGESGSAPAAAPPPVPTVSQATASSDARAPIPVVAPVLAPVLAAVPASVPVVAPAPEPALGLEPNQGQPQDERPPGSPQPASPLGRWPSRLQALRRPAFGRGVLAVGIGGIALLAFVAALVVLLPRFSAGRPVSCLPACTGADLAGRDLAGDRLVGADLTAANLYDARLAGADLTAATLVSATLAAADMRRATLAGADLRTANLRGAVLAGADLTSADLAGAVLLGADLLGADLTDADLTGANLAAARLAGAILTGIRSDAATRWPYGFAPPAAP